MELLILLASREGLLITRSEIADRLWASEVFVDTEYGIKRAGQWGGYRARLPWLLHQLQIKSKSQFVSPFDQALLYAQRGNREQTFALIDQSFRKRIPDLGFLQCDPEFDFLHADPLYLSLIQRIGLPAES